MRLKPLTKIKQDFSNSIPVLVHRFGDVFLKKVQKKFVRSEKNITFATAFREMHLKKQVEKAAIAQLVEHNLAKVGVASSSLVCRST